MDCVFDCALGRELTEEEVAALPAPSPLPFDQQQAALSALVDQKREATFAAGFMPASGPLAGKTLQVRDIVDRTNWLTSQAAYAAAIAAGGGAIIGADFRTADNETISMSYSAGHGVLLAMAEWGQSIMARSWTLKDTIAAAADEAALDAIDIDAGWPGDEA